jgi:hypothetical protein
MMRVSNKAEATISEEVRWRFRQHGVWSVKVNDRVTRGIPDIYIAGGVWIESKVIVTLPTIKNFPLKYFSALQRNTMDDLLDQGDDCFVAILFYGDHTRSFMLMPWYHFRRIRLWDIHTVAHFSQPYLGKGHLRLEPFGWINGKWNEVHWEENVFTKWAHHKNTAIFDHDIHRADLKGDEYEPAVDLGKDKADPSRLVIQRFKRPRGRPRKVVQPGNPA